jgi:hypothetical protein
MKSVVLKHGTLILIFLCFSFSAFAHKASDAYLTLRASPEALTGEWHMALRDLDYAMGLDSDDDGAITWGELKAKEKDLFAYASSRLKVHSELSVGELLADKLMVENHSDGAYAVLCFKVQGVLDAQALMAEYSAFFDVDPLHRGLLRIEESGKSLVAVVGPDTGVQRFDFSHTATSHSFAAFVKEGIFHIRTGYDHILFLVALLLPGVLRRTPEGWKPVTNSRAALLNVLQIATAFTIAHSMTLTLAATGLVQLSSRLVEAVIAATVALAALNNLVRVLPERGWLVAFGFGLIHGFGFAGALGDLGLSGGQFVLALLGFNLGVELGQLAMVAIGFPVLLCLKNFNAYRFGVFRVGSVAITLLASAWFAERCFDFKWLPF